MEWVHNIQRKHLVDFGLFEYALGWAAQYGADWIGRSPPETNLIRYLAALTSPRFPSRMCWNSERILENLVRYAL